MLILRYDDGHAPIYQTELSAGADLRARIAAVLEPGQVAAIPTGVWIDHIDLTRLSDGHLPELQIRARSGLAFRNSVCLANGVGTIDADFPDEICVLLMNLGHKNFAITPGDRIAQLVLNMVQRIPGLVVGPKRAGGFGSTGVK